MEIAFVALAVGPAHAQIQPVADQAASSKTAAGAPKKTARKKVPAKRRRKKPVYRKPGPNEGIRAKGEALFGGNAPPAKNGL